MPLFHNIKDGAIFIADVHYNKNRTRLSKLLDDIISNKIQTSQIIFMGDIFDFLATQIDYFKSIHKSIIDKINILEKTKDIIYLEGNHDYNLQNIFPNSTIIPRQNQPQTFIFQGKTISLAHGDIHTPTVYNIYTYVIRNHYILKFLNFIDISINNIISKRIENSLLSKKICHKIDNFNEFANNKIKKYSSNTDFIIEGHFHQGKIYKNYINIPSFACGNYYTQIKNNEFKNILY